MERSIRIETLTARSIAGMLYSGKLHAALVYQLLEEGGYDDKLELVQDLLMEMESVNEHYKNNNR